MRELRVSSIVLSILAALVEERTGLHYAPTDHSILAERAWQRAEEAGFESLLEYYYFLRYDPRGEEELDALVDALVVRETYFFRERAQLEVLARSVEEWVRDGRRPRLWSAACATGEEPLSLAMLLADAGLLARVDLIASDISAESLSRARAGRFGARALRDVDALPAAARFLARTPEGALQVPEAIRAQVEWRKVNLADAQQVARLPTCDAILCRNVLIYFSDATATRVVTSLADRLRPGGALFVGISESLLRFGTSLECEEHGNVFLYRKPT